MNLVIYFIHPSIHSPIHLSISSIDPYFYFSIYKTIIYRVAAVCWEMNQGLVMEKGIK